MNQDSPSFLFNTIENEKYNNKSIEFELGQINLEKKYSAKSEVHFSCNKKTENDKINRSQEDPERLSQNLDEESKTE